MTHDEQKAIEKALNKAIDAIAMVDRTQNQLIKVLADIDRRLTALDGGAKRKPTILNAVGERAN